MQVLADNGGSVLAEDGPRLYFFQRRILPTWLPFVLGVVAVIGIGNAVLLVAVGTPVAGAVLGVLGLAAAGGLQFARGRRRQSREAPLVPGEALLVVDFAARSLFDGAGRPLAPLDQVRFERAMQLSSSSRSLRAAWPGGNAVVYRGDPFVLRGGSIDAPVAALAQRGMGTA